jgi:hypothetical protein
VQQTRIAEDGLAEAAEMSGRPLRSTTVDFILPGLAFFVSGLHYCLLECFDFFSGIGFAISQSFHVCLSLG